MREDDENVERWDGMTPFDKDSRKSEESKPIQIPMSSPDLADAEIRAVNLVLQTRYLSIGPQMEALEQVWFSYVGAACAVNVSNRVAGLRQVIIG